MPIDLEMKTSDNLTFFPWERKKAARKKICWIMLLELISECCKAIFQWPHSSTDQTKRYMVLLTNFYCIGQNNSWSTGWRIKNQKKFWNVLSKFMELLMKTFLIQKPYCDYTHDLQTIKFIIIKKMKTNNRNILRTVTLHKNILHWIFWKIIIFHSKVSRLIFLYPI